MKILIVLIITSFSLLTFIVYKSLSDVESSSCPEPAQQKIPASEQQKIPAPGPKRNNRPVQWKNPKKNQPPIRKRALRIGISTVACLRKIGKACENYHENEEFSYPPDFTALVKDKYLTELKYLISINDMVSKLPANEIVGPNNTSFVYLGKGLSGYPKGRAPLAFEKPWLKPHDFSASRQMINVTIEVSVDENTKQEFSFKQPAGYGITGKFYVLCTDFSVIAVELPLPVGNCKIFVQKFLKKFPDKNITAKERKIILDNAVEADLAK